MRKFAYEWLSLVTWSLLKRSVGVHIVSINISSSWEKVYFKIFYTTAILLKFRWMVIKNQAFSLEKQNRMAMLYHRRSRQPTCAFK